MKHVLTTWEDNGYHDSYFYASFWDDETKSVRAVQTGATAYAGGIELPGKPISDPVVLQDAIAWLAGYIFEKIREGERLDVMEPGAGRKMGEDLRLVRDVRTKKDGVLAAGLVGRVYWEGAYGQFYRKGYNRPDRSNTRVGLELKDGRRVFVALSACRLDRELMSDEELRRRAWALAQHCEFSVACGIKHAWDSENYAKALKAKKEVSCAA